MTRFVTVQLGCDWGGCEEIAPEDDGVIIPMTLSIDGKPPKEFQLCKRHREQLDNQLLPLMQAGTKVAEPKKAPAARSPRPKSGGEPSPEKSGGNTQTADPRHCEVDGCGRTLHNNTGMAQHVIRTHGFESLAAYEAVYGHQAA